VINWSNPAAIVYGTPLSATQLNATSNVPGTFSYSPAAGTILSAGAGQTLSVTFTPSDPNYTTASKSATIDVLKAQQTITWAPPAPIVYGTPLSSTQLNATATAGALTYTPPAGTILNAGAAQTLTVTAAATPNYDPATKSVTIDVQRATPVITWAPPSAIAFGTALGAAQLNATADVAGTFVYTPAAGTILNAGNAQPLSVAFTPSDANHTTATAQVAIDVMKAQQTITWAPPAPIVYGTPLSSTQLNAAATAGALTYTPPAGTILSAGAAQTLTVIAAATPNYEAATKSVTIDVQRATPVITWAQPFAIVYGTALGTTQLNATADVAGAFVYTPAAGTILNGGAAQTLSAHFTPTDTHNYNDASATTTIDVAKAKQTLSWGTPSAIVYGTALGATQLNASVSLVGPAAAGALVYSPAAGTVLDAGSRTLTVTALETQNYLSATMSVSLGVNPAPLSLVVASKSKLYGATLPVLTGTLTGVVNNDNITPSYATTATQQSATGTYPIAGALIDPNHRLSNYTVTITPSTLTVSAAPLLIAANPATKQYSDPLPQLGATFTGFVLGETPSVLAGMLSITTTATPLSAPGTYPIAIGGLTSSNYAIAYTGSTLTVTQEDARVTITSPLLVSAAGSGDTTITLTATVKDISATADAAGDVNPGDIRKATLTFVDRTTHAALCTATIDLASASDQRIGVAVCTFKRTFSATATTSLTVGAQIGGYYVRDSAADDVTLSVAPPTTDFVTGGGTAGGADFEIDAKYEKNDNNSSVVKGSFTYTFQQVENGVTHKYELVSVTIDSLAVRRATGGGTAWVIGTGRLRDVTHSPIVIESAAPLIVVATDAGEPGRNDSISVILLKAGGGFRIATGWNGTTVVPQLLTEGNLQVHYGK
jgi:hypothetical protein